MTHVDRRLRELSRAARNAAAPSVDVRSRVTQTLAARTKPPLEKLPLIFTGVAVALAASAAVAFLPAWRILFEPWAGYFPG